MYVDLFQIFKEVCQRVMSYRRKFQTLNTYAFIACVIDRLVFDGYSLTLELGNYEYIRLRLQAERLNT